MRDTIDMAREAGAIHIHKQPKEFAIVGNDTIKAFEALVRVDERAGCCDAIWKCDGMGLEDRFIAMDVIKARGNK